MPADFDVNVPATTRGLQVALEALETFCDGRGIAEDIARRARVVIEELFTNTIKYGYGGECERPVRLKGHDGGVLTLVFEDEAPPFDLTTWTPPQLLPSERPEGRAGIVMILGLSSRVAYAQLANGNRITIDVTLHA
jgi:serine/threonine-protein kinase RsbW